MAGVAIDSVSKAFGPTQVLQNISLDIQDGEFLTLIGASGCGKSTLLRILAGLEFQDSGSVAIGGRPVDHLRPKERNIAMVFQSYALYPHMSVGDNIAMPLIMARLTLWERLPLIGRLSPRRAALMTAIQAEARAVAEQLQIDHLLDRKPAHLSGGQRQRVALGRAMVRHPEVFLMDEPLSNLDAKLRVHTRAELAELHRRLGATFIYVTHDQTEAMTMSDRVAMMDEGRIVQLGAPHALYHDPADLRVARFIGSPAINVLPGTVKNRAALLFGQRLPLSLALPDGAAVQLGLRPENVVLLPRPQDGALAARIRHVENLGSEFFVHFNLEGPAILVARLAPDAFAALKAAADFSAPVGFVPDAAAMLVFDSEGRRVRLENLAGPAARPAAIASLKAAVA